MAVTFFSFSRRSWRRRFCIDTEVYCVGAHSLYGILIPVSIKPIWASNLSFLLEQVDQEDWVELAYPDSRGKWPLKVMMLWCCWFSNRKIVLPAQKPVPQVPKICLWETLPNLSPSVLWHTIREWLGGRNGIRPVKTGWWGTGVVTCL